MAKERFYGIDQQARAALHVACADTRCGCMDCRVRRREEEVDAAIARFDGRRRDG